MKHTFRGIRPDDLHGRMGLRNPERGFRTEMYFSTIPGEIAGSCSCHSKQLKLDGRSEVPVFQNETIPGVPHLIRGNRLDAVEFSHAQWRDELDYFAYDGVTVMQSYCFLMKYDDGRDLPREKLDDIELFLLKVREYGAKVLLRFAYELSPTLSGPTAETVLKHLSQVRPLLRKYSDVIYVLQCGFVGKFGEWHNSFHKLQEDVVFNRELFSAVLEALPEDRCTMARYPFIKRRLFGQEPLSETEAFSGLPQSRIGHFNDGFMANPPYHGGTFGYYGTQEAVEPEQEYIAAESRYLPVDGELFWRDVGGAALPTAAVKNFHRWHFDTFSFVHGNAFFEGTDKYSIDIWKKVPVDPMFLINAGLPWSEDYFRDGSGKHIWRSYYEYIRDHLGYRIELQSFEYKAENGRLSGNIKLINRGFSAPVNPRPVFLIVGDEEIRLDTEIRKWYSNEVQTLEFDIAAPACGEYRAGLWLPDTDGTLRNRTEYAIRCANALEFADGVNWFDFKVTV